MVSDERFVLAGNLRYYFKQKQKATLRGRLQHVLRVDVYNPLHAINRFDVGLNSANDRL